MAGQHDACVFRDTEFYGVLLRENRLVEIISACSFSAGFVEPNVLSLSGIWLFQRV